MSKARRRRGQGARRAVRRLRLIPHKDFDEKTAREAAAVFNRAGEAPARVWFFYHARLRISAAPQGRHPLRCNLMSETNPQFVRFEMDLFWIVHPGQDPVKLFEKYGNRFELMHVKEHRKGTPTGLLTGHRM